jgi:hypothetical protein
MSSIIRPGVLLPITGLTTPANSPHLSGDGVERDLAAHVPD